MLPSQTLQIHRMEVLEIMQRYHLLTNLRIVGSVARSEDTENSDIDFLVDPLPEASLSDLGGLQEDLQELLGVPVSVISSRARMHNIMRQGLEKDAVKI